MPRHNRTGKGIDQRGHTYEVRYPPDWLSRVKVTRELKSGRQSTMHLFRNPANHREASPGETVRAGVSSPDQEIDFDLAVRDPDARITRVSVTYEVPPEEPGRRGKKGKPTEVVFTFENGMRPPRGTRSR